MSSHDEGRRKNFLFNFLRRQHRPRIKNPSELLRNLCIMRIVFYLTKHQYKKSVIIIVIIIISVIFLLNKVFIIRYIKKRNQ